MDYQWRQYSLAHSTPTKNLEPAPKTIPANKNQIPFGVYKGELPQINFRSLAKFLQINPLRRRIAEKQWRFASIFTDEVVCTAAIVHVGVVNAYFAYIFDRKTKILHEINGEYPAPFGPKVKLIPHRERVTFHNDDVDINIFTKLCGAVELDVSTPEFSISATLQAPENPLVLVSRVPDFTAARKKDSVNVTRKCSAMAVSGVAYIQNRRIDLTSGYGMVDDTAGLLARRTHWNWVSASGKSATENSPVWGVNLVAKHNDYDYTENGIWRNGELIYVGRANFDFNESDPMEPWHIFTDDDVVDLWFKPEGCRRGRYETPIFASIYDSPLGSYSGTICGERVEALNGLAENHQALW